MTAVTTLRERKKAATRQALHEAVLRLALAHGLDAVTVDAVADAANVSRRTFSNYFPSKEDALLYGDQIRAQKLLDEVRARPRHESAWQALTAAAYVRYGSLTETDQKWLAQLHLIRRHPSLMASQFAAQIAVERKLAEEIATRLPDGEVMQARIMAAVFLATLRTVLTTWVEQEPLPPLGPAVLDGLARAAKRFV